MYINIYLLTFIYVYLIFCQRIRLFLALMVDTDWLNMEMS